MTDPNDSPKLPARVGKAGGTGKKSKALERIRAATPAGPMASDAPTWSRPPSRRRSARD